MDWNDKIQVLKSLLLLYSYQTQDEQVAQSTAYLNGVGFNHTDAPFCSSVAQWVKAGKPVTWKQYDALEGILPKYSGQICDETLETVYLPETAMTILSVERPDPTVKIDGLLGIVDDKLEFRPFVYPTTHIKDYGFRANNKTEKGYFAWMAPLNQGSVNAVMNLFPNTKKDVTLLEWEEEQAKEYILSERTEASKAFPFQKEATAFLVKYSKALLGMAPGTGKSITAILAANEINAKHVLIICPLTLVRNWKNEIMKWTGESEDTIEFWYKTVGSPVKWIITNYNTAVTLQETLAKLPFDAIIIDESILIKNRKAKRTEAVKVIVKDCPRVWALSGAPISKFYDDMWAQFNALDPKRFTSYWGFVKRYCEWQQNRWGGIDILANQPDADVRLKQDTTDIYFARTQDQVLNLPPWIFDDVEIEMGKEQERLYNQMESEFVADLMDEDENQVVATNTLTQLLRLVQFASNPFLVGGKDDSPKWKAVQELLEYEKLPVLIWTSFILTAETVAERLSADKLRVASLTGKTAEQDRQPIVDALQGGNLDVIVAHPGVGKFGLTLTAAHTAIYLERGYNGDDYFQSLHRVRRIGTTESPHIIHLLSVRKDGSSTVDHVIARVLEYRRDSNFRLTTGILREEFARLRK